jgi:hypothetical protein
VKISDLASGDGIHNAEGLTSGYMTLLFVDTF